MIHRGAAPYLRPNIERVLAVIPNCNFWLIGDEKNRATAEELKINFERYDKFSGIPDSDFVNYSPAPWKQWSRFRFEKFCIDRWIILHKFMENRGIQEALYLDSDVLVLSDKTLDVFYDNKYDLIKDSNIVSVPFLCFWKQSAIKYFANYILELYSLTQEEKFAVLREIADVARQKTYFQLKKIGMETMAQRIHDRKDIHISDMQLIGDFSNSEKVRDKPIMKYKGEGRCEYVREPSTPKNLPITIKNVCFANSYNNYRQDPLYKNLILPSQAFQLQGMGCKKLTLKEGAYFYNDKEVPFLHLQGGCKEWQHDILKSINNKKDITLPDK